MNRHLADTAALMSDPGRAAILTSLLGGVALPAGRLAMIAAVAPQTASSHLAKLLEGRLLAVEQQGRHRYYRLANPEVASAIEALLAITPIPRNGDRLPITSARVDGLSYARTCYSHLAGRLAVDIADAFEKRGLLVGNTGKRYELTKRGRAWVAELGIPVSEKQVEQPRFARQCLDWTERRHHIAGQLGCAMLTRFRELKWIAPIAQTRAVRVTHQGQRAFAELLRLRPAAALPHL
ncbi:MAG: helix-turn-helix transcriptional regulator [Acidobacteria bacterium]|nr:helix-turn-helix transcriptional regulator [Acidobacteriota bacterium]